MGSQPFLGEIMIFAGNFAPRGYAFCNGQQMSIAQNTALFSILGTTYGGNGQTTFGLPDLRGRVPIHSGNSQGPGLSPYVLGEQTGTESVTLLSTEIPVHSHSFGINVYNGPGNSGTAANNVLANEATGQTAIYSNQAANASMAGGTSGTAGGNQPHNNLQPVLALNFCIALEGIFPSRN